MYHSFLYRLIDLNESCVETDDGDLINCQCNDAQRRIDNGQIQCGNELCPDDCDVCKYCLYYVVDCHSHSPSSSPSSDPSKLESAIPSAYPSETPSPTSSLNPSSESGDNLSRQPSNAPSLLSFPSVLTSLMPSVEVIPAPDSNPTSLPSLAPTSDPTSNLLSLPSSSPSLDPFDMSQCESYSNIW